jgi:DNA-binding PadR family transcriptional regulator
MFHRHGAQSRHHGRREMRGEFTGRPFGHHHHRDHGGGRGRAFEAGELRLLLLQMIAETPRHGYELIQAIEDQTGGAYAPSPGVIYPTLTLLEELGYVVVAAASEGGKKRYEATPAGGAFLDANRAAVDVIRARLLVARGSFAASPIRRAMANLKLALRLRLSEPAPGEDRVRALAAAIDQAAVAIERL